jgi:hypothetical protein
MTALTLTHPKTVRVNRTEFRDNLRAMLDKAQECTVVEISAPNNEDERLLLDRRYFDELVNRVNSLVETLEITTDQKLFGQIVRAASTLEEDTRLGKLHSFDEAFGED